MAGNSEGCTDHTVIDVDDGKICKKCIFKVPMVLRKQNSDAYTPHVVSIGPFHHQGKGGKDEGKTGNEEEFQLMERVKKSYLNEILSRMDITFIELTAKVTELSDEKKEGGFEVRARDSYAEPLDHISSEDLVEMMIVDGCFLIQLFRKCNDSKLRAFDDPVFNMDCMFHFLCHDILLLENQLPWFVMHSLYRLTLDIYPGEDSLSILIMEALSILPSLRPSFSPYHLLRNNCHCDADVLQTLDLVRASVVIPMRNIEKRARGAVSRYDIFDPDCHQMHTVTALSEAGIIFIPVIKESLLDIRFEERVATNGVLNIPQLNIGMSSETLFRNLIAIEQCYHGYSNEITSYVILMDNLISSKEDMELLCKQKVIRSWVSDEQGYKLFKNLNKDIPHNKFYYAALCQQVNARYKLRRYQIEGNMRKQFKYFSSPWKLLYVFVGIILLQVIPTILQTTFTIKQYYYPQT